VVEAGGAVVLAAGVLNRVPVGGASGGGLPKRLIGVLRLEVPGVVGQGQDAAEGVAQEGAPPGANQV